jgi:hypothetical protein
VLRSIAPNARIDKRRKTEIPEMFEVFKKEKEITAHKKEGMDDYRMKEDKWRKICKLTRQSEAGNELFRI